MKFIILNIFQIQFITIQDHKIHNSLVQLNFKINFPCCRKPYYFLIDDPKLYISQMF